MIYCALKDAATYEGLGKRFLAGLEYLRNPDIARVVPGRYAIEGEDVFAMVQDDALKPVGQCRWEAHRKYADIQYVVSGVEGMGVSVGDVGPSGFEVDEPYDEGKDVGFYRVKRSGGVVSRPTALWVASGELAVFLPTDVHMPLISPSASGGEVVRKIVIKVRV